MRVRLRLMRIDRQARDPSRRVLPKSQRETSHDYRCDGLGYRAAKRQFRCSIGSVCLALSRRRPRHRRRCRELWLKGRRWSAGRGGCGQQRMQGRRGSRLVEPARRHRQPKRRRGRHSHRQVGSAVSVITGEELRRQQIRTCRRCAARHARRRGQPHRRFRRRDAGAHSRCEKLIIRS